MHHPFDYLELSTGTLVFTPCPGTKGVSLTDSISQLKTADAAAIITLMPTHELQQNDVERIGAVCKELGLEWYQLPIEDDNARQQCAQGLTAKHILRVFNDKSATSAFRSRRPELVALYY